MAVSLTLGIVKPDAVGRGKTGEIITHLQRTGFLLRAARLVRLTPAEAGAFYAVHRGRPFYADLVAFMTSGPCLPMALEREDAGFLARWIGEAVAAVKSAKKTKSLAPIWATAKRLAAPGFRIPSRLKGASPTRARIMLSTSGSVLRRPAPRSCRCTQPRRGA